MFLLSASNIAASAARHTFSRPDCDGQRGTANRRVDLVGGLAHRVTAARAGLRRQGASGLRASRHERQNVAFEELIFPDEIHDLLRWSDWIHAYRVTAEFLDRKLAASGEGK